MTFSYVKVDQNNEISRLCREYKKLKGNYEIHITYYFLLSPLFILLICIKIPAREDSTLLLSNLLKRMALLNRTRYKGKTILLPLWRAHTIWEF